MDGAIIKPKTRRARLDGMLREYRGPSHQGRRDGIRVASTAGRALLRNLGLLESWARLEAFKVGKRGGFIGLQKYPGSHLRYSA